MRVIHLAGYGGPYPGSFIPMLRALNNAVVQRGWRFEAVFIQAAKERQWYKHLDSDGIAVSIAPNKSRRALTTYLAELVHEYDEPTILHTHFTTFDLPAAAVAHRNARIAAVWHMHTRLESGVNATIRNIVKFAIAGRQVARILCVSDDLRTAVQHRLAPTARLMDFPNAIDLEYFHRATEIERQRARAELDIPVERTLLVHFGWDWETKGGDLLLEAVVGLQRKGIEVIVMCVGGGHPARITGERLNLGRQLLVVPPRDDVRTFYAAADAFVACSRAEGMPFAVLEALSTGTPVVASTIPSHVLVAKQANGCVLSERSPHALAEAIRSVLSANANGDMAVDTGSLTDSLDLSAWARHLLELYTEIIRA